MEKRSFISVDDLTKLLDDTYVKVLGGIPKVHQQQESLLEKATCVHRNLYLFGPCVKPEMAELLFPCVSHFLQAVSGLQMTFSL